MSRHQPLPIAAWCACLSISSITTEQVTVKDLAREAAISPFHFARLFRAKVGVSPARYIVEMRLSHAEGLLRQTDMSVAEIALTCGYLHAGHFAAAFAKALRGYTPHVSAHASRASTHPTVMPRDGTSQAQLPP